MENGWRNKILHLTILSLLTAIFGKLANVYDSDTFTIMGLVTFVMLATYILCLIVIGINNQFIKKDE
jgi:predicted membrane channel-forming protein YqfA (hemolysin III family)